MKGTELQSKEKMMKVRVERSKEFVERLRAHGINGNTCVRSYLLAREIAKLLVKDLYVPTTHFYQQCDNRGIIPDLEELLSSEDFIIKSKPSKYCGGSVLLESELGNVRIVVKLDTRVVVFVTAYKINPETNFLLAPLSTFNFYF